MVAAFTSFCRYRAPYLLLTVLANLLTLNANYHAVLLPQYAEALNAMYYRGLYLDTASGAKK